MKIYEKVVIDIESGNILEEVSYDYNGPIAEMQTTTTTTVDCSWLPSYEYNIVDRGKPGTVDSLTSVAYDGSRYVAVGIGAKVVTSTDGGENWFQLPRFTSEDLFVVRYLGGTWYAGGRNVIYTSPDGLSWSYRLNPANGSGRLVRGFAYDGVNTIVAACWSHTIEERSSYSTNGGVTWTALPNGSPDMFNFTDLIYAEGVFVGCGGTSGGGSRFTYSSDGLNWSSANIWTADNAVYGLAHSGSRFFAVGTPGRAWISDDGISWTRTSQEEGAPRLDFDDSCQNAVWNGCQFVIAGVKTNDSYYPRFITTLDGYQPFTYEFVGTALQGGLFDIVFDGVKRHVGVGADGQIITADIHSLTTTSTTVTTTLPPLPTTTTCPPSLTDDDFNDGVIGPWWTLRDKQGGDFVESGGYMNVLSGPGGCNAVDPCTPTYIAQCIDPNEPYDYWIKVLTPTLTLDGQEYGMMSRDLVSEDIYAKVGVKRTGGTIYTYALYSGTGTLNEQTITLPLGIPEVWFRMVRDSSGVFWFYYALSQPHSGTDWTLFDLASGIFDQDGRQRVGLFATNPFPGTTTTTTTTTTSTVSTISTTIAPLESTTTTTYASTTTTITNFGLWAPDCLGTPGYHDGLQVSQGIYVDPGVWQFDTIEIGDMTSTSGYAKVMVYKDIGGFPTSGYFVGQTVVNSIGGGPETFSFAYPRPIITDSGTYNFVVTATDAGGSIAYGQTVTLYASPEHYVGGVMWYYDEGGPGWVEDSSSDALCIMLRGVLVYTPVPPGTCPSCPSTYYVTVAGLTGSCGDEDCSTGNFNRVWILPQKESGCEWRYTDSDFSGSITLGSSWPTYLWVFTIGTIYCGIAATWSAIYREGQGCPPTSGWRRRFFGGCDKGSGFISVSHS
jgi:photosystem II stability/assembly factor-like uncharacterized protein